MPKVKLTKGELKRQRESLKQFQHYLPTLQLKKQQLQMKILEANRRLDELKGRLRQQEDDIGRWRGVLADPGVELDEWLKPQEVTTETVNIAGANVPVFKDAAFKPKDYDLYETPLWIDQAIDRLRDLIKLLIEIRLQERQVAILQKELRTTTQRVNLFEKVKIPEAVENIRMIKIALGDQQASAVGIAKVAKGKLGEKQLVAA